MPVFFTHIEPVMVIKRGGSGERFYNHFHPEAEIKYVLDGSMRVRSADKVYNLNKGDIYISFPFEEHSFENLADSVIMTVIFSPEDVEPFGKQLCRYMPVYPLINVSDLAHGFGEGLCRTVELWSRLKFNNGSESSGFYSDMLTDPAFDGGSVGESALRAYLTAEVGELLERLELVPRDDNSGIYSIQNVLNYCTKHIGDPDLSMDKLSAEVGLSRSQISRLLSSMMKLSFPEFIHSMRINNARRSLLYTDESITSIAFECGFTSQRTFNRVFREVVGMTPSEYREAVRSGGAENEFRW
ncbi:MAG: helix-turn-helix domain-containing protein [Candidatus Flemingiibacterium sp.]